MGIAAAVVAAVGEPLLLFVAPVLVCKCDAFKPKSYLLAVVMLVEYEAVAFVRCAECGVLLDELLYGRFMVPAVDDEWLLRDIGGDIRRGDWCSDCLPKIRSVERLA